MSTKSYGWAFVALLLVFAGVSVLAYRHNQARVYGIRQTADKASYTNPTYGYTFYYDPDYTVRVYSEDDALIGRATTSTFVVYAEARIATSSDAGSYSEFLASAGKALCASETTSCAAVAETGAYTNEMGLAGTKYYLDLVTTDGTKQRFGPVYAFNVGANVVSAKYAALLIYRPLGASGAVEELPAEAIAKSLLITKVQAR